MLSLWLAAPAFANPLEGMLCETTPVAVTRMEGSEKLCRSFALALAGVPGAMSEEIRAMLTPESLAAMMTLSAAWLGSQGVPVVGQAVDGALVVLGVVLLAAQSAELSQALWTYVNLATAARSRAELEAAAAHLSRAIALVGVNVVAFILTKKTAGSFKPGPPAPGSAPALASGGRVVSTASPSAGVSTTSLPAFAAMGARPEVHRDLPGTGARKEPDPESFEAWIRQAPRREVQGESPALRFQSRHVGNEELLVRGGGKEVWADGYSSTDALLREVKHVDKPENSPFIKDSRCGEVVREQIRKKELEQFKRYAAVLKDPMTPAVGLELILNDARAVPFFEALMREVGIAGRIIIIAERGP
ncbi:restriction endonuclease fold toxin-2 domain-containing protein [Archangium sp.]|uniref:restriction endonuclease fold toxin-2 domain-containing protein n=1 Tax=Archangium sp. TaxID=1872627 RepID=UPI00286A963E|nr:restriction endonuclease fold toxin-2 domain-containing protein [Archangium sp.]